MVCSKNELIYKESITDSLHKVVNHKEASSQNITRADAALNVQQRNANAAAISNLPQGSWGSLLQKYASLSKSTTTPAAEHAAANERIAVTCITYSAISQNFTSHIHKFNSRDITCFISMPSRIMSLILPLKKNFHVKSHRNYLNFTTSHMFQWGSNWYWSRWHQKY